MYSASIVSFGDELGRPSIRLMFNSSHNITKRFPSRCFVIKSAGLTVPRIFSILSSWFFSFSCSENYFVSTCLIAPLPLRRASVPLQHLSRFALELRVEALVSCSELLNDTTFCVDDQVAKVC